MEKIKTAKGREFESDYAVTSNTSGQAYIRILNAALADVATVFSDKAHTIYLTWGSMVLSRYTRLMAIIPEGSAVKVVLGKE